MPQNIDIIKKKKKKKNNNNNKKCIFIRNYLEYSNVACMNNESEKCCLYLLLSYNCESDLEEGNNVLNRRYHVFTNT